MDLIEVALGCVAFAIDRTRDRKDLRLRTIMIGTVVGDAREIINENLKRFADRLVGCKPQGFGSKRSVFRNANIGDGFGRFDANPLSFHRY